MTVRWRASRSTIATRSRSTGAPTRTRRSTSARSCKLGQKVKAGDVLADGAATEMGQLALGANVTVAFMPWYGHNFEDAIVLSERLVKDDVYSSIHIQELELHVRDTKRGQEEITREIPNVAEEALVDLDERGIVRIGAHVKPGDILVGKITPKGETELSPEEKLLTAIFGEKAKDVKDSSLKVPPGMEGVVIDVKIFSRIEDQVVEKDRGERIGEVRRLEGEEKIRVNEVRDDELLELLEGQTVALALKTRHGRRGDSGRHEAHGRDCSRTSSSPRSTSRRSASRTRRVNEKIRAIIDAANEEKARIEEKAEERIDRILQPDELPPGVIQLVKVYLAEKRKISVGDKMAGRHGNKGIVARIVPEEDMPFLPDGRPVDIVLNPLGVPSRMNVGQILETHLGWAAKLLGFYAKTPVFQGANEREIGLLLKLAGVTWVRACARTCGRRRRRSATRTFARISPTSSPIAPERRTRSSCSHDATLNDLGSARDVARRRATSTTACATSSRPRRRSSPSASTASSTTRSRSINGEDAAGTKTRAAERRRIRRRQLQDGCEKREARDADEHRSPIRSCRRSPACSARSRTATSTRRRRS